MQGSHQYVVARDTHAGTSGTTAPAWPSTPTVGDQVTDNSVTWTCSGPAPTMSTLVLHTAIGSEGQDHDNGYGRYRVVHNRFIRFDTTTSPFTEIDLTGNTSDPDYGKHLKVTIGMHSSDADATGETLTTLFVTQ